MKVLDLFSGIGGFSLGLERAGMKTVAFCEIDPFCRSVLRRHWPDVPIHNDVTKLRGNDVGPVELICGGPPCHRTSVASAVWGYRTGETLWPEQHRLSIELQPDWVVVEQPPGNAGWEDQVQGDLAKSGYHSARLSVEARSCGAPHIRRRGIFLAHRDGTRLEIARRSIESAFQSPKRIALAGGNWSQDSAGTVRVADGVPGRLDRRKRIEALGNAFMPQKAEQLGKAIMKAKAPVCSDSPEALDVHQKGGSL